MGFFCDLPIQYHFISHEGQLKQTLSKLYLLIFEGVERETLMCCSTYLCIHCVLAGDPTYNLGVLG